MTKKEELLKAAESKVRQGGYSNFSFRELAADVGIKSASVHYHFPTKADLGAELAKQYTDNFMRALGDPEVIVSNGEDPISAYVGLFKQALITDRKMCLCGLLGAESDCLPEKVKAETQRFFKLNLAWLEKAHELVKDISSEKAQLLAIKTVSLLEGAMMISKAVNDNELFSKAAELVD
jgi:TetR/AcrR family transcriptional repressor of nem operon